MFKSSSAFDKLLDKATSLSNLEPDWASILQICDSIRQNDVQPKYAVGAIKKKLYVTNPNVVLMGLQVLESCVKNCGSLFHNEVATKQFMDDLHDVLKQTTDVNVRDEILRLVQALAHAFRNEPSYRAVNDKMKHLKAEGYQFPVLKESDAMFSADTAPEWTDGEVCHRCRVQFTMLVRKHHCRCCGQVFCANCSAKSSTIPKFGIEKEVRVCDVCYDKINAKVEGGKSAAGALKMADEHHKAKAPTAAATLTTSKSSSSAAAPNKKSEQEIQEEEELQLAIALSKSEAEIKERERMRYSQYSTPKGTSSGGNGSALNSGKHKKSSVSKSNSAKLSSSKSTSKKSSSPKADNGIGNENDDPELARYLNREYWEQRSNSYADYEPSPSPSAPQSILTTTISKVGMSKAPTGDIAEPKIFNDKLITSSTEDKELETFTNSLRSTIEIFVNRLNSNKLRGRPITNDNGVQSLFMNLTNLHSQLIMYTQQTNEARSNCERLQDKISQIRDARAALDALREEHREQMRRAAEEAERIRQQQMAQKLEIMRKKKQEYLQYQREIALQRMQEQEREFMMRQEQMKFGNVNPAAPPVMAPQWSNAGNVPPSGYYVPNQGYTNALPGQQQQQPQQPPPPPQQHQPAMGVNPQPAMSGQYVQSNLPNGSAMVASHHAPMPSSAVPMAVPGQPLPSQVMPQFVGAGMASMPNMYMPPVAGNFQPEVQPPPPSNQYTMAPPAPPAPQQPPQAPEASEELLIKFD